MSLLTDLLAMLRLLSHATIGSVQNLINISHGVIYFVIWFLLEWAFAKSIEMAVLLGLNKFNFFFRSVSGESVVSCLNFRDTEIQLVSREWVSSFQCSLTLIQLAFVTRYCRDITTNWWHCCLCYFWWQSETQHITDPLPSLFLMM